MTRTIYRNGFLAQNGQKIAQELCVEDGIITAIAPHIDCTDAMVVDLDGKTLYPRLIEEHSHGAACLDFSVDDSQGIDKLIAFYRANHVGTIFPTLMTDSTEKMCAQLDEVVKLSLIHI